VCKDLIATKQYERAAKVAMQIPYLCDRGSVLKDVSLALIGDGKSQDAMHVLGEIIRSARLLGEIDFLDIIKALKDKGELQIAEEILHKAIEVAMQTLDPVERASAARSICLALAANERCDRAIELVSQISSDDNEQEIAIYIISKALTKASKFEEAIRFASILTNNRINEFMLIARALIAKKQPQRAVSLLDKAFELTDKISNIEKHESLLRSIAIDFVSVGESEQACIVVSRISDNTKKMQAFTGMAEALIEQGELAHAEQIVEQAAQAAYQICHPDEQQAAFRSIAICFARSCSFEKAADLADRISSSVDRAQVVCFITNALLSAGRLEEAIAVAQSTNNEQMGGLALYDVVKALVKKGDFERASAIAQIIVNDRGQRGLAIELITQALEQKGLGL
jgi:tetratricopeptide (TPR) repeat protein